MWCLMMHYDTSGYLGVRHSQSVSGHTLMGPPAVVVVESWVSQFSKQRLFIICGNTKGSDVGATPTCERASRALSTGGSGRRWSLRARWGWRLLGCGDVGARLPDLVGFFLVHAPVKHPVSGRQIRRDENLVHDLEVVRPPLASAGLAGALLVLALVVAHRLEAHASLVVVGALAPGAVLGLPGPWDRILAPHDPGLGALGHRDGVVEERPAALAAPTQCGLSDHLERVLVEAGLIQGAVGRAQPVGVSSAVVGLNRPCYLVLDASFPLDAGRVGRH